MITVTSQASLLPESFTTSRPTTLPTPVRVSPPLRMKTAQTVTTAGLLNPAKASPGWTNPLTATAPRTSRAVTSIGIHSVTRNTMATNKIPRTIAIG